jgi:acetolactate synthase-1/2/3 large subunit
MAELKDYYMPTAAETMIAFLAAQGVDRAFCVPGESFIAVLDALHGHPTIDLVIARQEGGAGFMAVADAKLTGRPALVLCSRGPGACNASIAVHTAEQDAVPLILLVGQVEKRDLRRNSFQEIDYQRMFGGIAKWVGEATDPEQVPELIARAYAMAMQGVPGPVVLSLPEDVLAMPCSMPVPQATVPRPAVPGPEELEQIAVAIRAAQRPILLAGHAFDVPGGRAALRRFAEAWQLPVAVSFRRQDLFPNDHPLYAGDRGVNTPAAQQAAFNDADLVLALGTRMTDLTTQGWNWPHPTQRLIHVCAEPRFLGWMFSTKLAYAADAVAMVAALPQPGGMPAGRGAWISQLRDIQTTDSQIPQRGSFNDGVVYAHVARLVNEVAPANAILALDAGTHGVPFYRKFIWRSDQRLLTPVSGAMGFGVPAAVAAALRHPDRPVICSVGDGGVFMTGGELAVGVARGAAIKLLVSDNGTYATIRIHQELAHPGRVSGTDLVNPDLLAWASAFRVQLLQVSSEADFPALAEALQAPGPLIAVIRTSLQAVLPGQPAT